VIDIALHQNFYFENNNRYKRSLKVDLSKDQGEIIYRLPGKYDVFVINLREEVVKSLDIGYVALSNQTLIINHRRRKNNGLCRP